MLNKVDPFRNKEDIIKLKHYFYDIEKNRYKINLYRNLAIFIIGINTGLFPYDLINLEYNSVFNKENNIREILYLPDDVLNNYMYTPIYLNNSVKEVLSLYKTFNNDLKEYKYLFSSRQQNKPITRATLFNIIKNATYNLNIKGNYSGLSLRKTCLYHIFHIDDKTYTDEELYKQYRLNAL